jgi:hypothetical protein
MWSLLKSAPAATRQGVLPGNFTGDGVPDLAWQNPSTGAAQIWYMGGTNGATITGWASISSGNSWRIGGSHHATGNGHAAAATRRGIRRACGDDLVFDGDNVSVQQDT